MLADGSMESVVRSICYHAADLHCCVFDWRRWECVWLCCGG